MAGILTACMLPIAPAQAAGVTLEQVVDSALLSDLSAANATGINDLHGRTVVALPVLDGAKAVATWQRGPEPFASPSRLTLRAYPDLAQAEHAFTTTKGRAGRLPSGEAATWQDRDGSSTLILRSGQAVIRATCNARQQDQARACAQQLAQAQARAWARHPATSQQAEQREFASKQQAEAALLDGAQAAASAGIDVELAVEAVGSRWLEGGQVSSVAYRHPPDHQGISPTAAGIQQWGSQAALARAWTYLPAHYAANYWQLLRNASKELAFDTGDTSGSNRPGTQVTVWLRKGSYVVTGSCGTRQGSASTASLLHCARAVAQAQGKQARALFKAPA